MKLQDFQTKLRVLLAMPPQPKRKPECHIFPSISASPLLTGGRTAMEKLAQTARPPLQQSSQAGSGVPACSAKQGHPNPALVDEVKTKSCFIPLSPESGSRNPARPPPSPWPHFVDLLFFLAFAERTFAHLRWNFLPRQLLYPSGRQKMPPSPQQL